MEYKLEDLGDVMRLSIRRVNNATALGGAVNGLSFKLAI